MNTRQGRPEILIVDDKPENLYALEKLLGNLGVEVFRALSGSEALSLSLEHDFCVAIVDIQMPQMDGYELVELLRSNQDTATLPVIFVSAIYSDEYHHRKAYEAGAVDFMSKPLVGEVLISKVKVFIDLYQQRKSLEVEITNRRKADEALQTANLALAKRALQLETSGQIGQQATSILDLDELLGAVVVLIQSRFSYSFVGIWLLNGQRDLLTLRASAQLDHRDPDESLSIALDDERSTVAHVCRSGETGMVEYGDTQSGDSTLVKLPEKCSILALPLRLGNQAMGVLDIRSEKANAFDGEDQRVLKTLANQITIAIHNASLYEMEKELHHLEEEKTKTLTRLNADKDKFFSIISHDLRGPFNTVLGNAQLLANKVDTWPKEEIRDVTEDIYKGAKSAYNLLDNLLTWSRMQREDGMKVTPEPIALRELLLETITILKPTATQKEIELNLTLKDELWVQADRYMVETVVRNLIGNAMKFTPRRGKVTLAACPGGQNGDPGYVTLCIRDTGIGISAENLKKLFRIDTQLTTKGTEKETGSGLGLLICKEMVERNGGQIWVESEPDKGTTMAFTLPMITSPTT